MKQTPESSEERTRALWSELGRSERSLMYRSYIRGTFTHQSLLIPPALKISDSNKECKWFLLSFISPRCGCGYEVCVMRHLQYNNHFIYCVFVILYIVYFIHYPFYYLCPVLSRSFCCTVYEMNNNTGLGRHRLSQSLCLCIEFWSGTEQP